MFRELKEEVLHANLKLSKLKLSILTWGNVSQKSKDGKYFAIKPSGVSYTKMQIDDIVVINMKGKVVEGELNPSSDTPTHLVLYNKYPELKGIVHTHSPHGVAFAQAGEDIPVFGTTHADNFYGPVPCARELTAAEIKSDYEYNTGLVIVSEFEKRKINPKYVPGILVKEHGPFTFSTKSGDNAVDIAATLEEVAKMAMYTKIINPQTTSANKYLQDKHFKRKHGKDAYYGQKK